MKYVALDVYHRSYAHKHLAYVHSDILLLSGKLFS